MFEVSTIDTAAGSVRFATAESYGWTHPKGGWQGGRGWQIGNASQINDTEATNYLVGGKWMLENFFEALDAENEWFFDTETKMLYLIPNATSIGGAPTDDFVAVVLETLISINGTKAAPVKDITVQGITFRDSADITMQPWGVPSGGGACVRHHAARIAGIDTVLN
jgi:hypothetical protein